MWYREVFTIDERGRTVIKLPAHLHHALLGPRVKAYMARPAARPAVERISADDEKSNICADCGASMTITRSVANTTDVVGKTVIADMAEGMKTYFKKNRMREVVTVTAPVLYGSTKIG